MRLSVLAILLSVVLASPARAETPQELALTVGYSTSSVSPDTGGLVAVAYSRWLSDHWAWLIRPQMVVNLQRPDGQLLKGAAFGLDGGVAWQSANEGPRLIAAASIGPRLLNAPGIGAVTRLEAGFSVPFGSFSWAIGASGELGIGRVGDDRPHAESLLRGDLWTRVGASF
jgi:hypothetical protein